MVDDTLAAWGHKGVVAVAVALHGGSDFVESSGMEEGDNIEEVNHNS
jgi:hypothetical protein